jgi:acyl carrier protein
METKPTVDLESVKEVLVETLMLEDRSDSITAETGLFGSLPELDSLSVVELIVALERRFGISVEDADVSAEVFATLGSLTDFVAAKASAQD